MAFAPLKLPPGVVRPGTRYDARGRWYDANLVRWHEEAMQPIGGWQALDTTTAAVSAALSDDSGVFTDETTDANDAGADDVVLIPASPAENDAFYVGAGRMFTALEVNVGTAGTGNAVTWEYYNGSTWAALSGVSDASVGFTVSGTKAVTFTLPSDWATTTVNAVGPYYYVRARVTTAGSTTALGTQVWIGAEQVNLGGIACRGIHAWRANDQTPLIGLGTASDLYVYDSGALARVTPAGFTAGGEDAVHSAGTYGSGEYGGGPYGTGDEAVSAITEAQSWQFDNYGEDLVAVAFSDGDLIYYDSSAGTAAALTNAPTSCRGVVVTPERFIVALGAGGDGRRVEWCDQEDSTDWTPAVTNQAGGFDLSTHGQIMAGERGRNETLIWTDVDLHAMRYIGGALVYSFTQVGIGGAISRRSMAVMDGRAIWMGHRSFYLYDGFVKPIPCEVGDFVFNDINRTQVSKIACDVRTAFGEVWWYYPSSGSTECDRYVVFNYMAGHWNVGSLARTAGTDQGALQYPIATDPDGNVWQHEIGTNYEVGGVAQTPYAESGPVEIGNGDHVMHVRSIIPDEKTLGSVDLYVYAAMYPTADETTHGPYNPANPTDTRITARQVRLKVQQDTAGWRFGTPRLDVEAGGLR